MSINNKIIKNFLPEQYKNTNKLEINHNYLFEQFADRDEILEKIREVVIRGDFTLGEAVDNLEKKFAKLNNVNHAIGVGSGTDALFLSLKALGVDKGDEVITTPFTFYATIGAIVTAGATPVFCDIDVDFNINPGLISSSITSKTKAIIPVHWSGNCCDMDRIGVIAKENSLPIVSDACHAIGASYKGVPSGSLGDIACFSFHPLKNLNVWGDGGMIATNSESLANSIRLLRNHGLVDRDTCQIFAYNSRLDTIQAVVAQHILDHKLHQITQSRVNNATYLDEMLQGIPQIYVPKRREHIYQVFHIYSVTCENRDGLYAHLVKNGVDAKIHYPVPMHLQPAAGVYGHKVGDFPVAERVALSTISLPVHEFITKSMLEKMVDLVKEFYAK